MWSHGLEHLQQPKRKKIRKPWTTYGYLTIIIYNNDWYIHKKWLEMIRKCWNTSGSSMLDLHFGHGHLWPSRSDQLSSEESEVRLRRARTKKASGMKTKIVQSLWPGQNSSRLAVTPVTGSSTRTYKALILYACGVCGGLQCILKLWTLEKTHVQALLASSHSFFSDVSMLMFWNTSILLLYSNLAGLYVNRTANITWNRRKRQYHSKCQW